MAEIFDPKKVVWQDDDTEISSKKIDQDTEFSKMFENSSSVTNNTKNIQSSSSQPLKIGTKINGTILLIPETGSDIIVNLGNKSVGLLPKEEFSKDPSYSSLKVGDKLSAIIVGRSGSEFSLSINLSASLKTQEDLTAAVNSKLPIKATVISQNKGGFEVSLFGKKAFCPISQMDKKPITDKSLYLNKDFEFVVTKYLPPNDIVVSRVEALRKKEKLALEQLNNDFIKNPFLELNGTVSLIKDFGAFVELDNGLEGLVHKSEISWSRIGSVSDAVSVGDRVRVKVLKITEEEKGVRISLSMKSVDQDPWANIEEKLKVGDSFEGTIVKLERFGAFIEILPGIEGLLPISQISDKKIKHPSDILKLNDKFKVYVSEIDPLKKRITLSSKDANIESSDDSMKEWVDKSKNTGLGTLGKIFQEQMSNKK